MVVNVLTCLCTLYGSECFVLISGAEMSALFMSLVFGAGMSGSSVCAIVFRLEVRTMVCTRATHALEMQALLSHPEQLPLVMKSVDDCTLPCILKMHQACSAQVPCVVSWGYEVLTMVST